MPQPAMQYVLFPPVMWPFIATKGDLEALARYVAKLVKGEEDFMSQQFDNLKAAVAAEETVQKSCVTLLQGLSAQLAALASSNPTPAEIQSLADQVNADAKALSDAVVANTPAQPAP